MHRVLPCALRVRSRLVGGGALAGFLVEVMVCLVLVGMTGDVRQSIETPFALAGLLLGFAIVGWSGSIIAGRGFENLQRHLRSRSRWTEADSRRAMSRIAGFGAGGMIGATLVSIAFV